MSKTYRQGFTAVELLITIFVGVMFFAAVSQIYTVVVNDAAAARNKATASSLAYTQARTVSASLGATCATSNASTTLSSTGLPGTVARTTVVDCPFSAAGYSNSSVSRITVTITYGTSSPQESVKHALYKY